MVTVDKSTDEIVPDPSDALEFEPIKRSRPKRRGSWFFLLIVIISGGAGAGWLFYGDQLMNRNGGQLLVIRAAEGPVKVRPKTPGGMAIPDRDKLIYGRMKGDVAETRVERLLPPPEIPKTPLVPVAKPDPLPAPSVVQSVAKKSNFLPKQQNLKPGKIESVKSAVPRETMVPAVTVNPDKVPKEVVAPVTPPTNIPIVSLATPPAAMQSPSTSSVFGIAYQIQIAAVRTPERATIEWARLKSKHGDLLGGYSLNVVRADLGPTKGVFYRLRAGPIAWEDVAKVLCDNLGKRKVGCLIVRPGG
jgi:hypothetical protein